MLRDPGAHESDGLRPERHVEPRAALAGDREQHGGVEVDLADVEPNELVHAQPGLEEKDEDREGSLGRGPVRRVDEERAELGGGRDIRLAVVWSLQGEVGGRVCIALRSEERSKRAELAVSGGRGRCHVGASRKERFDVAASDVCEVAIVEELQERPRNAEVCCDRQRAGRGSDEMALEGAESFGSHGESE